MTLKVAFHQGQSALFARIKTLQNKNRQTEIHHFDLQPLKIQNRLFHAYCIYMYGMKRANQERLHLCS